MEEVRQKKKKKKRKSSLLFRSWLYFIIMTVVILFVLWMTELVVFRAYYCSMKELEIQKAVNTLVDVWNGDEEDERFNDVLMSSVSRYAMNVIVYKVNIDGGLAEAASIDDIQIVLTQTSIVSDEIDFDSMNFVLAKGNAIEKKAKENDGVFTHSTTMRARDDVYNFIVGDKKEIGGESIYFIGVSTIVLFDGTTMLLTNQLLVVTVFCVFLSLFLAAALSRSITKPITQFVQTARAFGKSGNRFRSSGYYEFDELAKALNTASSEMEKTEKLRRELISNVSHDLRTPLTMVKAYAEMIRDISGDNPERRDEHCRIIIDEVDRLTLLVNDMLDLSRLQSKARKPELMPVDLGMLVKTVMERFSLYEQQGYTFIRRVESDCVVMADERLIEQVFYNLLGNAINYTGDDKIVTINIVRHNDNARVEICDTGKGISPDERDKVWDRYYRSVNQRSVQGSGIGLSIVKSIFVAHSAKYGVDSTVGKGTSFWFELPLVKNSVEDRKKSKD